MSKIEKLNTLKATRAKATRAKSLENEKSLQLLEMSNINAETYIWYHYRELGHKRYLGTHYEDVLKYFLESKSYKLMVSDSSSGKPAKGYTGLIFLDEKSKCVVYLYNHIFEDVPYHVSICALNEKTVESVSLEISKYKVVAPTVQKTYLMLQGGGNLYLQECPLPQTYVDIEQHHNSDFPAVHRKIIDNLTNHKSGLYLFHGPPGTGKSSYIKYLTGLVNRKFVFVPSTLINSLTDCQIIKVLHEHKNSVLILEDAERAVLKREGSTGDSIVSSILNLSDGILGSVLNTSLILSFNTFEDNVDPALLRKGRLLAKYKFDKLDEEKSKKMLKELFPNKDYKATGDMTLAEIYNFENDSYIEEKKKVVGFSK